MDANMEFILYVYQTADMGVKSTTRLLNMLHNKDNKIIKIIEDELKEYEKTYKESKHILEKNKIELQTKGIITDISSYMGMKMEIIKDNSDARIADMLIKGFTYGVLEMEKKLERYKDIDKKYLKLGETLKKFQEDNIKILKDYV